MGLVGHLAEACGSGLLGGFLALEGGGRGSLVEFDVSLARVIKNSV